MSGRRGSTLIEVLVTCALLGVVLSLLMTRLTSTTAQFRATEQTAALLRELTDTTAYAGDRASAAQTVRIQAPTLSCQGVTLACTPPTPCLSVLVPEQALTAGPSTAT